MKSIFFITGLFFYATVSGQGKFYGGSGDGFATASTTNLVLPLQVTGFFIAKSNAGVDATLAIVSAENICEMQLEKSNDAVVFAPVSILHSAYPGLQGSGFHFNDSSHLENINYYRIKITRCDGRSLYTGILFLRQTNKLNSFYYSTINKTINYSIIENGNLQICNSIGQLVYQVSLYKGTSYITIPQLSGGVYFLLFSNAEAGKIIVE